MILARVLSLAARVLRAWRRQPRLCPGGVLALVIWTCLLGQDAWAARVALLVGVGTYEKVTKLEGPPHDVAAMRDVLVRRWGFAPDRVRTLVDGQATRQAILDELRGLLARSAQGDEVLIYMSGHGTSVGDSTNLFDLPHGTGAFMPYDFDPRQPNREGQLIVGRRDLVPLIKALEDAGRRVWYITDSCYSGSQARSGGRALPARMAALPADPVRRHADFARLTRELPPPYPYRETVTLAASAEGELARDIRQQDLAAFPTQTGKPHGAFTDALLRVLEGKLPADSNRDGALDVTEIHDAITSFMATRAYGQTPQRLPSIPEDVGGLNTRPLLAAPGAVVQPPRAAAPQPLRVHLEGVSPMLTRAVLQVPGVQSAPAEQADVLLRATRETVAVTNAAGDVISEFAAADTDRLRRQVLQRAWAKQLGQLAHQHRRGAAQWEYQPARRGGSFYVGEQVQFTTRPDREGWLVVVNIDSEGSVSVLYPWRGAPRELLGLPAGRVVALPPFAVEDPVGVDTQFVFLFDQRPDGLERLAGLVKLPATDSRLNLLFDLLSKHSSRFVAAQSDLRVYPKEHAQR